ncbi:MAG: hypothetical protein RR444_01480 [Oscillospiraceae bacterium]
MLQIYLTLFIFIVVAIPVGQYLYRVADHKHTFADPVFNRIDPFKS